MWEVEESTERGSLQSEQSHLPTRGICRGLNKHALLPSGAGQAYLATPTHRKGTELLDLYKPRLQATNYNNISVDKEDF